MTIFAYLHVISAMAWLGGGLLFVSTLAPSTRRMTPAASLEFLATAVPRMTRYFFMAATSTVIFGPSLFLTIPSYSPLIYAGIATGLAAYIEVLLELRLFTRISNLAREALKGGPSNPPSAELQRALRHGRIGTLSTVLLRGVTLMFMVYSGYPF